MASIWGNTGDSGGVWTSTQVTGSVWCPTSGSRNLTWNCQVDFDAEEDTTDNYYYFADIQYSTNNSSWTAIQTHQLMTEDTSVHTTTSRRWYLSNHSVTNGCPGTGSYYYRVCIGRAQSSTATLDVDCCYGYTGSVQLYWTAVTNSTSPTSIMINGSTSNATINAEESFQVSWSGGTKGTNWSSWHVNVTGTGGPWDYYVTSGENMYDDFSFIRVGNTYTYRVEAVDGSTGRGYNKTITVTVRAKPITITLDPDGGSVSSTTFSTSHGTQITNLPTPTKAGFAFKGWYLDLNKTSVLLGVSNGTNFKPTGNRVSIGLQTYMSSYAASGDSSSPYQWLYPNGNAYGVRLGILGSASTVRARVYTATSESAGTNIDADKTSSNNLSAGWHYWNIIYDGTGTTPKVDLYLDGTKVTTTNGSSTYKNIFWVQNQPFYIGSQWFTGYIGNVTIYQDTTVRTEANTKNSFIAPRHDITLKARWERTGYVLTVNPNGGSYGGSTSNSSVTVTWGTNTTLSAPTRAGYNFVGWACASGSRLSQDFSAATGFFTAAPNKYIWGGSGTNNSTLALETMDTGSGFPATLKMLTITEPGTSTKGVGWSKTASGLSTSTSYLITFVAKAPLSTYFYVHNSTTYQGSGYTWEYLTPMAGTGQWRTYCIKLTTGTSISSNYTGYYIVCGGNTNVDTATNPGNISYNVAWTSIGTYTKFNGSCTYVPSSSLSEDTVYAVWIEKQYTISYNLNSGAFANPTDYVYTSGSYRIAQNPLSALWNRSPYAMGTGSALGTNKPTANSPGYYFNVQRPTKAATASSSTTTYTTTFNATANGGASNSTKTNTKTVTTSTPNVFYSWTITGMDSSTHQYWGRANSGVTTNSTRSFTSTSITLTGEHHTDNAPPSTFRNLRQSPGTVTFTAGWTPGTATTTTTTTSITFPAIPSKANTTATSYVTTSFNYNGASGTTPSAITSSATATVTWAANKWWTTQTSGGTSYTAGSTITPTASATYYARYTGTTGTYSSYTSITMPAAPSSVKPNTAGTGTISFNGNSGTASVSSITFTYTTSYKFGGWTTSSSGTSGLAAGATFTPTASATRYAAWAVSTTTRAAITLPTASRSNTTANQTVTFNLNPPSGTSSSTNTTFVATTAYTMKGWYTAASGGTKRGDAGASWTPNANSATLYAQWNSSTTAAAVTAPAPTIKGYWCAGYYDSETGGTKKVAAGGTYTPPVAGETLYAQWWKCCYVYKTSDSKWHRAIPYVYKSSAWKRAEPYVYKSSWK